MRHRDKIFLTEDNDWKDWLRRLQILLDVCPWDQDYYLRAAALKDLYSAQSFAQSLEAIATARSNCIAFSSNARRHRSGARSPSIVAVCACAATDQVLVRRRRCLRVRCQSLQRADKFV